MVSSSSALRHVLKGIAALYGITFLERAGATLMLLEVVAKRML
jgi:hypothetical protein